MRSLYLAVAVILAVARASATLSPQQQRLEMLKRTLAIARAMRTNQAVVPADLQYFVDAYKQQYPELAATGATPTGLELDKMSEEDQVGANAIPAGSNLRARLAAAADSERLAAAKDISAQLRADLQIDPVLKEVSETIRKLALEPKAPLPVKSSAGTTEAGSTSGEEIAPSSTRVLPIVVVSLVAMSVTAGSLILAFAMVVKPRLVNQVKQSMSAPQ